MLQQNNAQHYSNYSSYINFPSFLPPDQHLYQMRLRRLRVPGLVAFYDIPTSKKRSGSMFTTLELTRGGGGWLKETDALIEQ